MNLRKQTGEFVEKEKFYTAKVLQNLAIIDRQKLFSDYGYPSLYKYLTRELKYSDSEANIRVAAVRLIKREKSVAEKIAKGKISLTNAAEINTSLNQFERENKQKACTKIVQQAVILAENKTTRRAKEDLRQALELKAPRRETLILEEKLKSPHEPLRAIAHFLGLICHLCQNLQKVLLTPTHQLSLYPHTLLPRLILLK